jgi:hypothetical protein
LLEKSIVPHDTFTNGVKQLDTHSKIPLKITFQINWIIHKVAPHQLGVPFDPLPPKSFPTKNGRASASSLCAKLEA